MAQAKSRGAVFQMIAQNDEKHDEGHARLRKDLRTVDERVEELETEHTKLASRVLKMESAPPEVAQLRFSPAIVVFIVTTAVSISGGIWASTAGLREHMISIDARLATQAETEKANAKLLDERAATLRDAVAAIQRQQQLQAYEIQALKEAMLKRR